MKNHFQNQKISRWISFMSLNLIFLLMCNGAFAQKQTLKGKIVSASDNMEVIGAAVQVEGTTLGTITGIDGSFVLPNAPINGTLVVTYIGYKVYKTAIQKNKIYEIKLIEDTKVLDEVVVVGYGTMRKKEVTGSVARVNSDQLNLIATSDVGNALQGQVAGVNVQSSSGQPGATANIQIRGISSINGSNNPLYVVDGVPYEGDPGLSSSEIESMDVLKDAASAAIYGTRGAGGVILITTKSGKAGEMKVSVDSYYGIQKITSGLNLVSSSQAIFLSALLGVKGEQIAPNYIWNSIWNGTGLFTNDSKILPLIEKDNQPIKNVSVNLSGGKDNLVYNVVANYFSQDGILINSGYERYNIRANSTFKKNKFTFTSNLSAKFDKQESPAWGLYQQAFTYLSTSKQVDPNISLDTAEGDSNQLLALGNVLAKFKETNVNDGKGFNANFAINYNIIKGLSFNTRLGAGYNIARVIKTNPLFKIYDSDGKEVKNNATQSGIRKTSQTNTNLSWENVLNYGIKLGKHDIKATAVFSMEKYTYESFYAQKKDLISNELPSLGAATGDQLVGVGTGAWEQDRTSTLVGMLGRIQYNYAGKYLLSASIRKDGSSRFTKDNRWGYFPSVSAGWAISEEKFFKPLLQTVNQVKIRASYGTTGNQNFQDYLFAATLSTLYDYAFQGTSSGSLSNGMTQTSYANADVKWETTDSYNAGIDLAFLNNKITFSADAYINTKKNLLFPLKVPPIAGTGTSGSVIMNVGDMENKGIELAFGYRDKIGKLNYHSNLTFSRNVNKITRMAGTNKRSPLGSISTGNTDDNITFLCEGMEAGVFLMMPTNGIVNTDEKLQEYQKLRSDAKMGDLIYVDTNKDGLLNDDDRVKCGSGTPKAELGFNYGFEWKGFDLSMNWYASLGNKVVNGSKVASYQNNVNLDQVYQWSLSNPTSSIPAYRTKTHYNSRTYADIWVEDGSFVRLKNVVIGYSLPKNIITKLRLTKLRFYLAGDNLLTFTKYDGYNPEVGGNGLSTKGLDMGNYPIAIQMRGGLQLDF